MASTKDRKDLRFILLKGPKGSGKTTCATTISEHESGELKDTYIIDADANGTESLHARNVHCDYMNLFAATEQKDRIAALKQACEEIQAKPEIKHLIFSGFSTVSYDLEGEFKAKYPGDKFGLYAELITEFRKIFKPLRGVSQLENLVVECHTKAESEMLAKDRVRKLEQGETKLDRKLILDVAGKTGAWLERQASMVLPVFMEVKGGRKEYAVYPNGYPVNSPLCSGRHRFGDTLDNVEKPNLRQLLLKGLAQ